MVEETVGTRTLPEDEATFLWATAALGEARGRDGSRARHLLEAVVEDLAFELGARSFPPPGARGTGTTSTVVEPPPCRFSS